MHAFSSPKMPPSCCNHLTQQSVVPHALQTGRSPRCHLPAGHGAGTGTAGHVVHRHGTKCWSYKKYRGGLVDGMTDQHASFKNSNIWGGYLVSRVWSTVSLSSFAIGSNAFWPRLKSCHNNMLDRIPLCHRQKRNHLVLCVHQSALSFYNGYKTMFWSTQAA